MNALPGAPHIAWRGNQLFIEGLSLDVLAREHHCRVDSEPFQRASVSVRVACALAVGIGMGLAYGWLVDPVDFFDLSPDTLRADYKTDYVLMTAEAYHVEQDE